MPRSQGRFLALILAAGCLAAEDAPPPVDQGLPGAGRGQDADGRIPKVAVPPELGDPDRWRWLPPARIVEGGLIDRLGVTSFPIPIVFREEAVGTGVGVALFDIDFRGQGRREVAGIFAARTTQGQENYGVVWKRYLDNHPMPGGGMFQRETAAVTAVTKYEKTLTRRFFGYGPDTTADDETSCTDENWSAAADWRDEPLPSRPALTAHGGLRGEHHGISEGTVPKVPATGEIHPGVVAGADNTTSLVLIGGLAWDTRDSAANPYRGYGLSLDGELWSGGDRVSGVVFTGRGVWALPLPSLFHDGGAADLVARGPEENPPTDVLALGFQVQDAHGELPFYALPSLGGSDTLRGYLGNRFTDRAAWHASAEWRTWFLPRGFPLGGKARVERLGLAPFIDVGTVASSLDALPGAKLHVTPGIGLRIALERTVLFRLDVARSDEQVGVNFTFGMAF
jgi:hypothetical protein